MHLLGFLIRFVIVSRYSVGEIFIHIGVARKHGHNRETLIAGRAERTEPLYIRYCHKLLF